MIFTNAIQQVVIINGLHSFSNLHFADNSFKDLPWGALDDVVMGGVSESNFQIDTTGGENGGPTGIFRGLFQLNSFAQVISVIKFTFCLCPLLHVFILSGVVSTANNGGFTSIRTRVRCSILA